MHRISIPEDVVAQITAQRGRLNRYDSLIGAKTALVVIDLQNVFMLPGMPVEVPTAREIVPNVNRLAAATRDAGGKVVWVKMNLEGQSEAWRVFFDGDPRRATLSELTPGSRGFELYADLDVRGEDTILVKKRYSAFIQGSSDIDRRAARGRHRHGDHRRHLDQCLLRILRPRRHDAQLSPPLRRRRQCRAERRRTQRDLDIDRARIRRRGDDERSDRAVLGSKGPRTGRLRI